MISIVVGSGIIWIDFLVGFILVVVVWIGGCLNGYVIFKFVVGIWIIFINNFEKVNNCFRFINNCYLIIFIIVGRAIGFFVNIRCKFVSCFEVICIFCNVGIVICCKCFDWV